MKSRGMHGHRISQFLPVVIAIFLGFLVYPIQARGQITVDNVIVHLGVAERPVHNVIVGNSSNSPAYVRVDVEAVREPGTSEETVPTEELLASPKTFSIEPNGQRTVRLLLKTPPTDRERVFRVSFIPQDRGFGEEVRQAQGGVTTVIKVLTGMGILVFADPASPKEELRWERNGDKIILNNSGNVNIYLGDGESCSPTKVCSKLPSKRLYESHKLEITSPPENTVTYLTHAKGTGQYKRLTMLPTEQSGVLN